MAGGWRTSPRRATELALALASIASQASAMLRTRQSSGRLHSQSLAAVLIGDDPEDKSVMGISESLRTMMCWGKPELIEHKQCLKWMTEACSDHTTGQGTCDELKDYLKQECISGENAELACTYARELGANPPIPPGSVPAPTDASSEGYPEKTLEETGNSTENATGGAALDKTVPETGLPEQGFDGHSMERVEHHDAETQTDDWGQEWPQTRESDAATKEKICRGYPRLEWCKLFMSNQERKREAGESWGSLDVR